MLTATCHCGKVSVTVPSAPETVYDCNCSICRRYGTLWAYYEAGTVRVEAASRATSDYAWGRKNLRFVRCADCGCVMYWELMSPDPTRRMGVNARNFDPVALSKAEVGHIDGASG